MFPEPLEHFIKNSIPDRMKELVTKLIIYWYEVFKEFPYISSQEDHKYIYFCKNTKDYTCDLELYYDGQIETFWRDRVINKYGGEDFINYKEAIDYLHKTVKELENGQT